MEIGGLGVNRAAVGEHRVEHRAEHDHADADADPEDQHVEVVNLAADLGGAFGHVQGHFGAGGAGHQ